MHRIPQSPFTQAGRVRSPPMRSAPRAPAEGRIALRFFRLESGSTSLRFVVEPPSFELAARCTRWSATRQRESQPPVRRRDGEVQTRLTVERWSVAQDRLRPRAARRGGTELPASIERFLHAPSSFALSLQQAWSRSWKSLKDRARGRCARRRCFWRPSRTVYITPPRCYYPHQL